MLGFIFWVKKQVFISVRPGIDCKYKLSFYILSGKIDIYQNSKIVLRILIILILELNLNIE